MYYHSETRQCFELYRRGPCPSGNMINFLCGKNNIPISIFSQATSSLSTTPRSPLSAAARTVTTCTGTGTATS